MAIVKVINTKTTSKGSTKALKDYLDKENSIKTGIGCNSEKWERDFNLTKSVFEKNNGRQYSHLAQSFEKKCKLSPKEIHQCGLDLVEKCKQFKDFQAIVITHTDKNHTHNHIVINSVNSRTGKKLQFSPSNLKTLKKNMENDLFEKHKIEPTRSKKGIVKTQSTNTHQVLGKALDGKSESYLLNLTLDIKKSLDNSTNIEIFRKDLKIKNIKMNISDNHNTVLFTSAAGKKISSKKIKEIFGNDFGKKSIQKELEQNRFSEKDKTVDYTEQMIVLIREKEKKKAKEIAERKELQKERAKKRTKERENNRGWER